MNLNQERTNSLFRKSNADIPKISLKEDDLIFPFEVKTGFVNATEEGFVFNSNVQDYIRFERIFTGYEAVSAIWEQSTAIKVDETATFPNGITKFYKPGIAWNGHIDNDSSSTSFGEAVGATGFTSQIVTSTVTVYTKRKVERTDILKFYAMPKKYGKTLFYIEDVNEYTHPKTNKTLYSAITFHSLDTKLAETGLAIDQYIQLSAPGEGYAWPAIIDSLDPYTIKTFDRDGKTFLNASELPATYNGEAILVNYKDSGLTKVMVSAGAITSVLANQNGYVLDETKLKTRPIKSIQLELYTPNILSSIYAYGRPISKSENSNGAELGLTRKLLPQKFIQPVAQQREINKPFPANNSFYWLPTSRMELESFYNNWSEKMKGPWNPGIKKQWLGYLRIKAAEFHRSSSIGMRVFWDWLSMGIYEIVRNFHEVSNTNVVNEYHKTEGVQGLERLLADGYFKHLAAPRLPLNFTETIPWTLKDIPIVGGLLSKISLGMPTAWKNSSSTGGQNYNVSGLVSAGLVDFHKNTFMGVKTEKTGANTSEQYTAIPLDGLSDEADSSVISQSEYSTILRFNISDIFSERSDDQNDHTQTNVTWADRVPSGRTLNTVNLGFEDATNTKWTVGESMALPSTVDGYTIDAFGFHAIGSGNYKVLFLDENDDVVFTGRYKTLSKLTGSIRDWSNNIKLSHWQAENLIDPRKLVIPSSVALPTDATQAENGMPNGWFRPIYHKDTNGNVVYDQFGNPVIEHDANGNEMYERQAMTLGSYIPPRAPFRVDQVITWEKTLYAQLHSRYSSDSIDLHQFIPQDVFNRYAAAGANKLKFTVRLTNLTDFVDTQGNPRYDLIHDTNSDTSNDYHIDPNTPNAVQHSSFDVEVVLDKVTDPLNVRYKIVSTTPAMSPWDGTGTATYLGTRLELMRLNVTSRDPFVKSMFGFVVGGATINPGLDTTLFRFVSSLNNDGAVPIIWRPKVHIDKLTWYE